MFYPDPPKNPRRVRCGIGEFKVGEKTERRRLYIHTTKVLSIGLALELRSRAHNLVPAQEATAS